MFLGFNGFWHIYHTVDYTRWDMNGLLYIMETHAVLKRDVSYGCNWVFPELIIHVWPCILVSYGHISISSLE